MMTATLDDYGPPRFVQVAQQLQDYEVMSKWLKKDKVIFDGGVGISRIVMDRTGGAARHLAIGDEDVVNIPELLREIRVDWVHASTNWGWNRIELLQNKGKAVRTKVIDPRRGAAMLDLVEELESKAWSCPAADDTENPKGVPYAIVKNATEGFNGGYPSGHTTMYGADLTTLRNFKNWTGTYTAFTRSDAIRAWRKAFQRTRWKSPIGGKAIRFNQKLRFYVNQDTELDLGDIGTSQNENIGPELAKFDGMMLFKGVPIIAIPQLDYDTQNPIYGINHDTFFPVVLKGNYLRESEPDKWPNHHNWYVVFIDLTYNYLCLDRRRNFVLYQTS